MFHNCEKHFFLTREWKHSFAAVKGKHSLAAPAKPWVKRQNKASARAKRGRGVWESNPPGAAPSDPPAVLKTVRPTGAPTPPCLPYAVLCHVSALLSSHSMPLCERQIFAENAATPHDDRKGRHYYRRFRSLSLAGAWLLGRAE